MELGFDQHPNWEAVSTAGLTAYMRVGRINENAVQLSFQKAQPFQSPLGDDLTVVVEQIAAGTVERMRGEMLSLKSQAHVQGRAGLSVAKTAEFPYFSVWTVSDGKHLAVLTFVCDQTPDAVELEEVEWMVNSIRWSQPERKKWWKF